MLSLADSVAKDSLKFLDVVVLEEPDMRARKACAEPVRE